MGNTANKARQLLPILAALIAGVSWGQKFIAKSVLPEVDTYGQWFKYETYDNSGRVLISTAKRGKGAPTKEVPIPKNGSVDGWLEEYALETSVDYTEVHAAEMRDKISGYVPSGGQLNSADRLKFGRLRLVQHDLELLKEQAVANLVFADAAYDAANIHTAVDFSAAGIIERIMTDRRRVEKKYGWAPDKLILGWNKWTDLVTNPEILARVSGGSTNANPAEVTKELIAATLGFREVLVGTAVADVELAEPGAAAATQIDLWDPDRAAMIWSGDTSAPTVEGQPSPSEADLSSPAFGKIFFMNVPETGVPYSTQEYDKYGNGKVAALEATEFYLVSQVMKCGALYKAA